jgi:hypothetical protein
MKRPLFALAALALLAGCSVISPEAKVRSRLIEAGLKPHLAACLAEKLVRKLSTPELEKLNALARIPRTDTGRMSIDELSDRLGTLNDPHIVDVVTRSGLGCAILG